MNIFIGSLCGYLIGSIPFALVIGKVFYHTDVREHGSGNPGGTNAGRVLGKKAGLSVIILDAVKSLLIMVIFQFWNKEAALYAGAFAAVGHCFPVFAGFKGGKAVATTFGFLLGVGLFISPQALLEIFVIPLAVFLILLRISKYVSLSAMVALVCAAILSFIFQARLDVSLLISILALFVIYRHHENIDRLRKGTERKVGLFDKKK